MLKCLHVKKTDPIDRRTLCILWAITLCVAPSFGRAANVSTAGVCQAAGSLAEQTYGVPAGMLNAIGRVESGRRHPLTGQILPWPWTINTGGAGRMFETGEEALKVTQRMREGGVQSIDVGCFQVNLQHHPTAFRDLTEAFDPRSNANYAARFLVSLYTKLHSWDEAVAAYHSSTPVRGGPYKDRVLAGWARTGDPTGAGDITFAGVNKPSSWAPALVKFGMQVWTPSMDGIGAGMIEMRSAKATRLLPALPAAPSVTAIPAPVAVTMIGWSGCASGMPLIGVASKLKKC